MENGLIIQSPTPVTLLEKAIEKGVDINQLKELMDLQDRWEKKEAKKSFLEALSRFQSLAPTLKKKKTAKINSQKGSYSYKYSDLGSITSDIKDALKDCGLSYRWEFNESNERMKVTCIISHCDGHSETTSMEAGRDTSGFKNDIQQKGSTHTYLQRYTLIGGLGLSTADEDNDAKGSASVNEDQREEEAMNQWRQSLGQVKNRVELQALYLKNKKSVDSDDRIKLMFKDKEAVLKSQEGNGNSKQQVNLP